MKIKNLLARITNSRLFWLAISLIASLAIWSYVTSMESDEYTETFRNIRVELLGEDVLREKKNLVITDLENSTVTVSITGPRRIVASLSSADLTAQVDVSKLSQSAYTSQQYTISYPEKTDTSALSVSSENPSSVSFMVSLETSKTIPVKGSFNGETAEGFSAEMPQFEPSFITVSGPEAYLKDISYAWVSFGEGTVDATYSVETGYILRNDSDEECSTSGLSFSEDTVIATLPILMVKDIPLTVNLVEGAGATSQNTKVTIEPEYITLAGDSSVLSGLNRIELKTIDLTDFNSTFNETYSIIYDDDLINMTGVSEANVQIEIIGLETRSFTITNISYINLTEGYSCTIETKELVVSLRGTPEVLDAIEDQNLRAEIDLTDYDLSEGSYRAPVIVRIDGFTDVGMIGSQDASVVLRKQK